MATYAKNQSVRLTGTYSTADGLLTEPSEAVLRVRKPDGEILEYTRSEGTLDRVSDGQYAAVVIANVSGRWLYSFSGEGVDGSHPAGDSYFDVTPGFG